ncbi:serine/threonine-protein kinase [Rathayibacter iranicus]|uniref:non-specific serine/threonine protein kinase n=2 Tax=Rathayibacter iranicus TaxID=59737 RepID=A0AAD1AGK9_9MICO|nr:serine/threonine-protein kinase [Rathayibacter iranicus]AZZ56169.1 serine/threonine protein kinase [Rathayibacter iranicus]MWV30132.1 protein kinase [Rathayibacter iranicus NCPPB 2253 = VKM Ac-1602]PPI46237.1 serine/threonine protein kinase [Rathayibacter iranicus]PPI59611.1 serine/threonine protein kinase [Rathayibacter iranicus]PPI71089.1 serine/threonine protein kinase [Rathayibacter iranicus]
MSVIAASAAKQKVAGRYYLIERIGSGGMGSVYRARDESVQRDVAVKVFRAEASHPDDIARQEREVRMLSSFAHPGIVNLFDAGLHNFGGEVRRYVVMEFVADPTLEARLESGPLPADEVAAIGTQLAEALAYLHERGVVHRDVKPANILVSDIASSGYDCTAKLADFGVAHFMDGSRLTGDGIVIGTASFVSPEQVAGEPINGASDVFSLGLVLLEAMTGHREYTGTVLEAAIARLHRSPAIPETVPAAWRSLLSAMTARDPSDRPTAEQVAHRLRGGMAAGVTEMAGDSRSARVRRSVIIGSSVVGVGAIAALSWMLGALVGR